MKLSVSNLAWGAADQDQLLPLLVSLGVTGIEVAPTKVAAWDCLNERVLLDFRKKLNDIGISVSSLQAIFFGKPDACLLGDHSSYLLMCDHIDKLADIASVLGCDVAVFGAPKNRLQGDIDKDFAFQLARERFFLLGEICQGRMKIGIEPVPQYYGCDFIQSAKEDLELVKAINHPAIGLHLDTACVFLQGDSIEIAIREGRDHLIHFHIAEPDLSDFSSPKADHHSAAKVLNQCGYLGWLSIEMKETENPVDSVTEAVHFAKSVYFN